MLVFSRSLLYVTCSHETQTKSEKMIFLICKNIKCLKFKLKNDISLVIIAQLFSRNEIINSPRISFVFYWLVKCLLGCIFVSVLATLSEFRGNRSHMQERSQKISSIAQYFVNQYLGLEVYYFPKGSPIHVFCTVHILYRLSVKMINSKSNHPSA